MIDKGYIFNFMVNGIRIAVGSLVILSLFLISGCERRALEDMGPLSKIVIEVNSNSVPNYTTGIYNDQVQTKEIEPDVVRALFYSCSEDRLIMDLFVQEKMLGPSGEVYLEGQVPLVPGDYRMIIYSFGAETAYIDSYESYENACAYTDPVTLAFKAEEITAVEQPDHIFTASSQKITVPMHQGENIISVKAESIVESYYMQLGIEGLRYISSATAILNHVSSSVSLSTGAKDNNPASLYIPLTGSSVDGKDVVCAVFNTFGIMQGSGTSVTFKIIRTDGETFTKTCDISAHLQTTDCMNNKWILIDDVIEIPAPDGAGGEGYDPVIKDWDKVDSDVEI